MPPNSLFSSPDSDSESNSGSSSSGSSDGGSESSDSTGVSASRYEWIQSSLSDAIREARWKRIWVTRRRLARVAYIPTFRPRTRSHSDSPAAYNPFSRSWRMGAARRHPAPIFLGPMEMGVVHEDDLTPLLNDNDQDQETEDGHTIATRATYFHSEGGLTLD